MMGTTEKLSSYVTSFSTSEQYSRIERVFDSFGGKFTVKKDETDSYFNVFSDDVGVSLFGVVLLSSSVVFLV